MEFLDSHFTNKQLLLRLVKHNITEFNNVEFYTGNLSTEAKHLLIVEPMTSSYTKYEILDNLIRSRAFQQDPLETQRYILSSCISIFLNLKEPIPEMADRVLLNVIKYDIPEIEKVKFISWLREYVTENQWHELFKQLSDPFVRLTLPNKRPSFKYSKELKLLLEEYNKSTSSKYVRNIINKEDEILVINKNW